MATNPQFDGEWTTPQPMPNQSASIAALADALAKAQGQITGALKDSSNPFFKSKYADLASCWDACRKQLADNGLSVIQTTEARRDGLYVVTTLAHKSGEWIRGYLPVKTKDDGPQAQGSGITYARRYALAAIVGLAQIDDDAESAQGRTEKQPLERQAEMNARTKLSKEAGRAVDRILAAAEDADNTKLRSVWDEVSQDHELATAAWSGLPTPLRNRIRDIKSAA